ncbi:MAG: hypothetical protein OEZ54_06255 [Gemmatimonadota bacterium]|nr:hypothetical protein [Gemmatimonadota bacterium]
MHLIAMIDRELARDAGSDFPIAAQVVGILVFSATLLAQVPDLLPGVYGRDGLQILIGKAMASGDGMRLVGMPNSPPVSTAPVYPFLMSLVWRVWPVFPANVTLMVLIDAALLGVAAFGVARYSAKLITDPWLAYVATLAAFLNLPMVWAAAVRVPEIAFLAAAIWAALVSDYGKHTTRNVIACGSLAVIATLSVSVGWIVLPAVVVGLVRRGEVRSAAWVGALSTAMSILVWWIISSNASAALPIGEVGVASQNGLFGFSGILEVAGAFAPFGGFGALVFVSVVLLGAAVYGARTSFSKAPALVTTMSGLVLIAPIVNEGTAVWVMIPGLVVLASVGLNRAALDVEILRTPARVIGIVLAAGFVWTTGAQTLHRSYAESGLETGKPFEWVLPSIRQELPDSAVIAVENPFLVHLHTGRATAWPDHDFPLRQTLCEQGTTHLIENRAGEGFMGSQISGDSFVRLFAITEGPALYRLECGTL